MGADDLFTELREQRLAARAPLAERMRPRSLDEVVGQDHLVAPGAPLRRLIEADRVTSVVLWGPPGTGKTTLAELIASMTRSEFVRLSAVTSGVKDVREAIQAAKDRIVNQDRRTIVFIDEIHRFSATQQDSLLHAVETGTIGLIGATTENPSFSLNPALRSRANIFELRPIGAEAMVKALERALDAESHVATPEALELLATRSTGDLRVALGALEVARDLAGDIGISLEHVESALNTSVARLGTGDHYDLASAFIKAMRAGDADAALHWLAMMLAAGEDPAFIARRMMIFASEDVGVADPQALILMVAVAQAVSMVGLPEARHHLAHGVVHLALSPKSRAVTDAIGAAEAAVARGVGSNVPPSVASPPEHLPRGSTLPRYYGGDRHDPR